MVLIYAPGSTSKQYLCSQEQRQAVFVLPGTQASSATEPTPEREHCKSALPYALALESALCPGLLTLTPADSGGTRAVLRKPSALDHPHYENSLS